MEDLIITFYTPSYEKVVEPLIASIDKLGLALYSERLPEQEEWELACALKPQFIQFCQRRFTGRRLLWVDADAVVHRDPWPLLMSAELADFGWHTRVGPGREEGEVLSGTLLINPTANARELVDRWLLWQQKSPMRWDQKVLADVIAEQLRRGRLNAQALGPELCMIFDTMRREHPGVSPVIEHFQASRQVKAMRQGKR